MLNHDLERILNACHHDPRSVLGWHPVEGQTGASGKPAWVIRAHVPGARSVRIVDNNATMRRVHDQGLFEWSGDSGDLPVHYTLEADLENGLRFQFVDPYSFAPQLAEFDLHLFGEGKHWHLWRVLGARLTEIDGVAGAQFAVWAPNADRVSVVGDFNTWDGRRHMMINRGGIGVWELFIPGLHPGDLYKFEIRNRDTGNLYLKSDPLGQQFELRPNTSSILPNPTQFTWTDGVWLDHRARENWQHRPMSIYEAHLGSWQRDDAGNLLSYRELAHRLSRYLLDMGFTHVELLPITEHPFDYSWGYQTTGYFAPTSRFGTPDDFRYFVNHLHENGIGVLLDWVPAHFPKDAFSLARFDGTALYEHEDPRLGEHKDWGTLIFNYGRNEVKNFLLASALYWIEEFHIDGLRVDAVASMLYLDYSRKEGEWLPNRYGGRENLDAIDFLRDLNHVVHGEFPGALVMAEESTSWPMVSRPTYLGGLGFSMKWNMGWMNDTLRYFSKEPIHRQFHHNDLTFGLLYAYTENFILPFSHDEVVHGKGSLLRKMPGDEWQAHANLRLLLAYQFSYPGKKLLFMGCEFGQGDEWQCDRPLDWWLLQYPLHQGQQRLVRDLNRHYIHEAALHHFEFDWHGFEWIDCNDAPQSVLSYVRKAHIEGRDEEILVVLNLTPVAREGYRVGLHRPGRYVEILNTDHTDYGGSGVINTGEKHSDAVPWHGKHQSMALRLPPLGVTWFKYLG